MDFVEIAGVSILVKGGLTCCVLILYALRQTKLSEQQHAEMTQHNGVSLFLLL